MKIKLFASVILLSFAGCVFSQELSGPEVVTPGTLATFEISPPQNGAWVVTPTNATNGTYQVDETAGKLYFAAPNEGEYTVKRGMFAVEKVGTYQQTLANPPKYTNEILAEAQNCQVGACYLGNFKGKELARVIFDCLAAGFPVTFGNSVAVSQQIKYTGKIKTAINSGTWMHATARVAYRKESDGTEYIAHQGSWGKYWEVGTYEKEPASIIWESFDTFVQACSGRYVDAFAICMVEGEFLELDGFDIAPVRIGV